MGNSPPKARPGASLPRLVASLGVPTLVIGTDLSGFRLGVSVPVLSGLPVYQVTVQRWLSDPPAESLRRVCVCVRAWCACVYNAQGDQRRVLDSLELEFQATVSCSCVQGS